MRYQCALIAVKDVKKSLAFYKKWFNMEVEVDLGWNIGLKGGLAVKDISQSGRIGRRTLWKNRIIWNCNFDCET